MFVTDTVTLVTDITTGEFQIATWNGKRPGRPRSKENRVLMVHIAKNVGLQIRNLTVFES